MSFLWDMHLLNQLLIVSIIQFIFHVINDFFFGHFSKIFIIISDKNKRYLSSVLSISRDMSHAEAVNCCDDWTVHD